ncbi:peptidyl-tRNA hydrolase ICT1, mitochondrial-like [Oppia nitens]|uniref:peptidyl-tRNA hydrolase ICT1, mitochondrial-like n=1 Tax=Oppia nitens TaxID=1686743 RepID=UPI0023DAD61D|nr:peptidyl-tRNA hydrolase ICT1, mitochondrial-like [Oppia nitens]
MFCLKSNTFSLINRQLYRYMSSFDNLPVFKSQQSLDNLYPKSQISSDIKTNAKSETDNVFSGHIPIKELQISYCRSSGPGGQHVNKTNTKVTVQFQLSSANWIPNETKEKLKQLHKNNINKDGFWIIRSDKTRAQLMNLADCLDKIRCYITEASKPIKQPSIETLEKIRENREKAAIRRLEDKKKRSLMKSDRQSLY